MCACRFATKYGHGFKPKLASFFFPFETFGVSGALVSRGQTFGGHLKRLVWNQEMSEGLILQLISEEAYYTVCTEYTCLRGL